MEKKHSFFGTVLECRHGEASAFCHAPGNELLKNGENLFATD